MKILILFFLVLLLQSCDNNSRIPIQNATDNYTIDTLTEQNKDSMLVFFEKHSLDFIVNGRKKNYSDSVYFFVNTHFVDDHVVIVVNNKTYFDDTVTTKYLIGIATVISVSKRDLLLDSIVKFSVNNHLNYVPYKCNFNAFYDFNYIDNKVTLTFSSLDRTID